MADPNDPFTVHEALHVAYLLQDSAERYLADHPAVVARPEIRALADRAVEALGEVYQALGGVPPLVGERSAKPTIADLERAGERIIT